MKMAPIFIFLFFLLVLIPNASADTIYLKNGRSIEGIITKETDKGVWVKIEFGKIQLGWKEIENIDRSSPAEAETMRQQWQRERELEDEAIRQEELRKKKQEEARRKKELEPKEVEISKEMGQMIIVEALLNNKVKASLCLDTGASCIVISNNIAKQLGIKKQGKLAAVKVADGRTVTARFIVLASVNVQGVEAKNVEAAVLLGVKDNIKDGLLGMSFLKRFKFQIDTVNNKLILQKLKPQDTPPKK